MMESIDISVARQDEWSAAFTLALQHVPPEARATRVANALALLGAGEIDPAGILVARTPGGMVGVQVCIPLRGASGLFWLPQVVPDWRSGDLARRLVATALAWLPERGAKLAQALLHPSDLPDAEALLQCGFRNITQLQYLRHTLDELPAELASPDLRLESFSADNAMVFQETLLRTYEDTLDCPELNGVRTIEEVMDGHRAQGIWHPETWWVASVGDRPAGIVMLTELVEAHGWDLSYVGLVPEFRGRGLGRRLATTALHIAKSRGAAQLLLAVDRRNVLAGRLYDRLGFEPTEVREVLLQVF